MAKRTTGMKLREVPAVVGKMLVGWDEEADTEIRLTRRDRRSPTRWRARFYRCGCLVAECWAPTRVEAEAGIAETLRSQREQAERMRCAS